MIKLKRGWRIRFAKEWYKYDANNDRTEQMT